MVCDKVELFVDSHLVGINWLLHVFEAGEESAETVWQCFAGLVGVRGAPFTQTLLFAHGRWLGVNFKTLTT